MGRWPANLILVHRPGCQRAGVKKLRAPKHRNPSDGDSKFPHGESMSRPDRGRYDLTDADGLETVAAWECEPDCPVLALDVQTGIRPSTWTDSESRNVSRARPESKFRPGQGHYQSQGPLYADKGGASRFFKQVGYAG